MANGNNDIDELLLREVQEATWRASSEWCSLGLALGIDKDRLKIIEKDADGCEMCLEKMLTYWLKNANPPTWQNIVNALCSGTVNRRECAETIGTIAIIIASYKAIDKAIASIS